MNSLFLTVLLCTFPFFSIADELERENRVNLTTPTNTFETCSIKDSRNASKEDLVYRLEACLTKNAQIELSIYLYLGASIAAGFNEADKKKKGGLDALGEIEEKYKLRDIFAELSPDNKEKVFSQVDVISLNYDLYEYVTIYSRPDDKETELKNVQVTGTRASGLEVEKDKLIDTAEREYLFINVEGRWLIDRWKSVD